MLALEMAEPVTECEFKQSQGWDSSQDSDPLRQAHQIIIKSGLIHPPNCPSLGGDSSFHAVGMGLHSGQGRKISGYLLSYSDLQVASQCLTKVKDLSATTTGPDSTTRTLLRCQALG